MLKISLLIGLVLTSTAVAQDQVKSSIIVENERFESVDMRVAYKFREYTWTLIEHTIDARGGVTYKYPSGLPGCNLLNDWGLDTAEATFAAGGRQICKVDFNMCEARTYRVALTRLGCGAESDAMPVSR